MEAGHHQKSLGVCPANLQKGHLYWDSKQLAYDCLQSQNQPSSWSWTKSLWSSCQESAWAASDFWAEASFLWVLYCQMLYHRQMISWESEHSCQDLHKSHWGWMDPCCHLACTRDQIRWIKIQQACPMQRELRRRQQTFKNVCDHMHLQENMKASATWEFSRRVFQPMRRQCHLARILKFWWMHVKMLSWNSSVIVFGGNNWPAMKMWHQLQIAKLGGCLHVPWQNDWQKHLQELNCKREPL